MVKNSWDDQNKDEKMVTYGSKKQCGAGNWTAFSKRSSSGQKKSGKGISSQKSSDPRQKSFTPQEEELVIQLHAAIGSRWPIIAQQLPGRTDNDVKILWNSKLRKKLSAMGIDPVTHKPFSQILAEYGNIGAFPKARTRFSSLSRDLKNAIIFNKSEQSHQKNSHTFNIPNNIHFSSSSSPPKQELLSVSVSDHHPIDDLYSQLEAVNFITEASNYAAKTTENTARDFETECVSLADSGLLNQEVSSFSWSDFILDDDAFLGQQGDDEQGNNNNNNNNGGIFNVQCDGNKIDEGNNNAKCGLGHEDKISGECFEGSSSSSLSSNGSSRFVDAMLESQDAMFSQLSCFSEEPFFY